jgi:hypothetical protein
MGINLLLTFDPVSFSLVHKAVTVVEELDEVYDS